MRINKSSDGKKLLHIYREGDEYYRQIFGGIPEK